MSIDFQCIRCWELVTVEDGTEETDAVCPHCQEVQRIPGYRPPEPLVPSVGPDESPEPISVPQFSQPGPNRKALRQAAMKRLKVPLKFCQWMLIVPLLMALLLLATGIGMHLEGSRGRGLGFEILMAWGLLTLLSTYLGIALYGLGNASRVGNYSWAVTGVWLTIVLGLNYLIVLPFAVWALVILYQPETRDAFEA